jgi:hypothetical protein
MTMALDATWRPGLVYQHAFDWLAIRLFAAEGLTAYATSADWQLIEMARRLPGVPALSADPVGRESIAAALGLLGIEAANGSLTAVGVVEPAKVPQTLFDRLGPGGHLYVIVGGRLVHLLAEHRNGDGASPLGERALVVAARTDGFRVVERLGIHPPAAILAHYSGEVALAIGRRDARDRRHFAMRRAMVTEGFTAGASALLCLTLERAA